MGRRLLFVDDEEGIRKVFSLSLRDMGYEVETARSGEEALERMAVFQPEVVISDIKMPGMGGLELLKRIKTEHPDMEVLLLTGFGDMDTAVQGLRWDAADFLAKPVRDEALQEALRRTEERLELKQGVREYTSGLEALLERRGRELGDARRWALAGQAVVGLSHTIKNIAGGLEGSIYLLEQGEHRAEYREQGWGMLKANVSMLKDLSLELLQLARPRSLRLEWCDPNRPLREVHALYRDKATSRGIDLDLELAPELPMVRMDPESIRKCLLNLVQNALDAVMENEGDNVLPRVVLRSRMGQDPGVLLEVEDNGCGMDEEMQNRLGLPFASGKTKEGFGLGVMFSKKAVMEHNGTLDWTSRPGRGSCFRVWLPERPGSGNGCETGDSQG
ncbi:MAG: response regulator [Desulfohalobiaceae bacterium]|nr:response regulator [Desulfohalobiaceae bacterium]